MADDVRSRKPIDPKGSFVATGDAGELLLTVTFGAARLLIAGTSSRMDRRWLVCWCHTAPDHPPPVNSGDHSQQTSYLLNRHRDHARVSVWQLVASHPRLHSTKRARLTTAILQTMRAPMADEHPLEQLLRDAKKRDDAKAADLLAERRKATDLQEKVGLEWLRAKSELVDEIGRANAILEKHDLSERYTLRDLPEPGTGNVARCNLSLAYPSKPARAEYDVAVVAADGRINLHHRATGQRHQQLTVFAVSRRNWEAILIRLYEDHLKKGREPHSAAQEPATDDSAPAAVRKSR